MHGPQFFQTAMGRTFFEGTVPRLYRAVDRLADALVGKREYKVVNVRGSNDQIAESLSELGCDGWRAVHFSDDRIFLERVVPRKEPGQGT